MANDWDAKLKGFLKKTGEDFKRAGNDIKAEAQKLMKEVKDPEGQEKLKAGMAEFGGWAKKTAKEMADLAEKGFKQAEGAFRQAGENWKQPGAEAQAPAATPPDAEQAQAPTPTPPSEPPEMEASPAPAKKTIGKKKTAASGTAKPRGQAKKTIGKKPTSS